MIKLSSIGINYTILRMSNLQINVVVMDELIFEYLDNYFNVLSKTGYLKYDIVESLIGIICLNELKETLYGK